MLRNRLRSLMSQPLGLALGLLGLALLSSALLPAQDPWEYPVLGYGTAVVDGQKDAGEWEFAGTRSFQMPLPWDLGGGSAPASLYVMNDDENLYLAVEIEQNVLPSNGGVFFTFDNDHDGVQENGDDDLRLWYRPDVVEFGDYVRTNLPPCPAGLPPADCQLADTDLGGTNDGQGAFNYDGSTAFFELVHPLNSADDTNDFSLGEGDTVGFNLLVVYCSADCANAALVPGPGTASFAAITIVTRLPFPKLTRAQVSFDASTGEPSAMLIFGENFGPYSAESKVELDVSRTGVREPLALAHWSENVILASLPPTMAAGTYRLRVSTGVPGILTSELDVTIGPAGPPGPQGPQVDVFVVGQVCPEGQALRGYSVNQEILCADLP